MNVKVKSFEPKKGTQTPWGRADYAVHIFPGVVQYDTEDGDGGLAVTYKWAEQNLSLQAQYIGQHYSGRLWYENDCERAVVCFEHPKLQPVYRESEAQLKKCIQDNLQDYFSEDFGKACQDAGPLPSLFMLWPGDLAVFDVNGCINLRVLKQMQDTNGQFYYLAEDYDGNKYSLKEGFVKANLKKLFRDTVAGCVWKRPVCRYY